MCVSSVQGARQTRKGPVVSSRALPPPTANVLKSKSRISAGAVPGAFDSVAEVPHVPIPRSRRRRRDRPGSVAEDASPRTSAAALESEGLPVPDGIEPRRRPGSSTRARATRESRGVARRFRRRDCRPRSDRSPPKSRSSWSARRCEDLPADCRQAFVLHRGRDHVVSRHRRAVGRFDEHGRKVHRPRAAPPARQPERLTRRIEGSS